MYILISDVVDGVVCRYGQPSKCQCGCQAYTRGVMPWNHPLSRTPSLGDLLNLADGWVWFLQQGLEGIQTIFWIWSNISGISIWR